MELNKLIISIFLLTAQAYGAARIVQEAEYIDNTNINQKLMNAVINNNIQEVRNLIALGAEIDSQAEDQLDLPSSPARKAIDSNDLELVRAVFENNPRAETALNKYQSIETPLESALYNTLKSSDTTIVRYLLNLKTKVLSNVTGRNLLHELFCFIIPQILGKKKNRANFKIQKEIISLLLERGISIEEEDMFGNNVIYYLDQLFIEYAQSYNQSEMQEIRDLLDKYKKPLKLKTAENLSLATMSERDIENELFPSSTKMVSYKRQPVTKVRENRFIVQNTNGSFNLSTKPARRPYGPFIQSQIIYKSISEPLISSRTHEFRYNYTPQTFTRFVPLRKLSLNGINDITDDSFHPIYLSSDIASRDGLSFVPEILPGNNNLTLVQSPISATERNPALEIDNLIMAVNQNIDQAHAINNQIELPITNTAIVNHQHPVENPGNIAPQGNINAVDQSVQSNSVNRNNIAPINLNRINMMPVQSKSNYLTYASLLAGGSLITLIISKLYKKFITDKKEKKDSKWIYLPNGVRYRVVSDDGKKITISKEYQY